MQELEELRTELADKNMEMIELSADEDTKAREQRIAILEAEVEVLKRNLEAKNNMPTNTSTTVVVPANDNGDSAKLEAKLTEINQHLQTLRTQNENLQQKLQNMEQQAQTIRTTTVYVQERYSDLLKRFPIANVYFGTNSAAISKDEEGKIAEVANILNKYEEARLAITGYTDQRGDATYNLKLSKQRAEAVKKRLIDRYGVSGAKLEMNYHGKDEASQTGDNPFARKVELKLTR